MPEPTSVISPANSPRERLLNFVKPLKKRNKPYVWVTWITGLLAETDKCRFQAWVKSNYQLPKEESGDSDGNERLAQWIKDHDSMTEERVKQLKAEGGWVVRVEDQNSFKLEGATAVLGGKPDIVALRDDASEALIVDEKSGKAKDKYFWQVLVYMFAMVKTHLKGFTNVRGEIEYKGNTVHVPATALSAENHSRIVDMMKLMGNPTPPPTTPSAGECRFCDVTGCPDRFTVKNEVADVRHLF